MRPCDFGSLWERCTARYATCGSSGAVKRTRTSRRERQVGTMAQELLGASGLAVVLTLALRDCYRMHRKVIQPRLERVALPIAAVWGRMWRADRMLTHDEWCAWVRGRIQQEERNVRLTVWREVTYRECEHPQAPGRSWIAPCIAYDIVPCGLVAALRDNLAAQHTHPIQAVLRQRAQRFERDVLRTRDWLALVAPLPSGVGMRQEVRR
jgi:hypothetical protein